MRPQPNSGGFALIETLIATAIIAAMLGLTFQTMQNQARGARMVEDRRKAMLVAQSQLAAIGASNSTAFGETRGVSDGINWRVSVTPYRSGVSSAVRLQSVRVSTGLVGNSRALVTLNTLRVAQ